VGNNGLPKYAKISTNRTRELGNYVKVTGTQPSLTINQTMKKGTCLFQDIRNVIKEAGEV
jgi:hypothetical protein